MKVRFPRLFCHPGPKAKNLCDAVTRADRFAGNP